VQVNILEACCDPKIFAPFFRTGTWEAWFAFLVVLFGLPPTAEQLAIYQRFTGRVTVLPRPASEGFLVCGRRAGKSFILALIAVFLACFKDWRPYLGPGEVGTVMIVCHDRRQSRVIMRYCLGLLRNVPMLKELLVNVTQEQIELRNQIVVEIHTASFRSVRGYTVCAALVDEIAYLPTDELSSEPDVEILNALRPAMATIPGAMLLCASSPYARRGALWGAYSKHYGKDGDPILVWQADTRSMNPTVPQSFIDQHMAEDAPRASAEYLAQFRTDIESYISREAVEACVLRNVFERPPERNITYFGFVDPAGGSGTDSMTLAIAHKNSLKGTVVVDAIREARPPFSPERICSEFAVTLKSYGISKVFGDRYAGAYPVEQFRQFGIVLDHEGIRPKSDLYVDLLPLVNAGRIELLDNARLINQLCALERRTARGGRDTIDHPSGSHDDVSNACAGAAALILSRPDTAKFWRVLGGGPDAVDEDLVEHEMRLRRFAERERRDPRCPPGMSQQDFERYAAPPPMMDRDLVAAVKRAESRGGQS
jgi:hypothetical protein